MHVNNLVGGGQDAEGAYLIWRPDASSQECKSFGRGAAAQRRGFTPLILSFIDGDAFAYAGKARELAAVSMMESAQTHPEATQHRLLWRIGGESGFTTFPAQVWQVGLTPWSAAALHT
jgi:hypothetical protein